MAFKSVSGDCDFVEIPSFAQNSPASSEDKRSTPSFHAGSMTDKGFALSRRPCLSPIFFWGELKKDENRKRIWKANLDPLRLFSFHSVQLRKLSGAKMDSTSTSRRSRTPSLFPCRSSPNSSDLRYRAFSRSPRRCFVLMPKQKLIASFRYNRKAVCEWLSLKKRKPHLSGKEKIGLRRSISRWYVYSPKPIHYEFLSFRTLFHGFPPTETTLPPTAPWCWTSQSHSVQWCRWTCQTDLRKRDGRTSPISQVQVSPLLNGCFIMETPIKMDNLGVPLFLETSKWLQQQKSLSLFVWVVFFFSWKNRWGAIGG